MRIFGLDGGIASIGWAVVDIDETAGTPLILAPSIIPRVAFSSFNRLVALRGYLDQFLIVEIFHHENLTKNFRDFRASDEACHPASL